MKVSIIVPCYNLAEFLPETIASVLNQSYLDWECIVVDDGSTDNTEQVAKELLLKSDKLSYCRKENGGLSSARNFGIKKATGTLILPLDSDDLLDKTFLEKAVAYFLENSETKIVYSNVRLFGEKNEDWPETIFSLDEFFFRNLIPCTALYRKEDWALAGGYKENMRGGFEDWDFWMNVITRNQGKGIVRINEPLFLYRQRVGSMAHEISYERASALKKILAMNNLEAYARKLGDPLTLTLDKQDLARQLDLIQNSWAFKIGELILLPIKAVKSLFTNG